MTSNDRLRIVILGGGFGGVYTAMSLESIFRRTTEVEIVLVNKENYFVFQPMLAEVVSGSVGLLDTVSPLRRLLRHTQIYVREVDAIDLDRSTVTLSPGFRPRPLELHYDHLVIALGTVTDFRGIPGLHEHALPFKTLADAVHLRNHLIQVLGEAAIEDDPEVKRQLLTFVVGGGGFSGVEVAAEMNDFLRRIAKDYATIDASEIRVILVHSRPRILERELRESLSLYAQKVLRKRGVELLLNARLQTASPDAAVLADGRRIATKTLVSTVPSTPHPLLESLSLPKTKGRLQVDRHLQVEGCGNVWALGDCAVIPDGAGGSCPPTAQYATREAKTVAGNVAATIRGKDLRQFSFKGLGKLGSLGHRSAVAELFNRVKLSGFPAWVIWRTVYWWKLPGLDRKLKTGITWLLDLLIRPETVQLRIETSNAVVRMHYEPGEVVFRQGDVGDALYIILDGEADVIQDADGEEKVLARMGPGEFFGEMALLNEQPRSATVRCATRMSLLALRQREFRALVAHLPGLRGNFDRVMEQRLRRSLPPGGDSPVD